MFELLATVFDRETTDGPYECQQCGLQVDVQHHCCPQCDGYSIERIEWTSVGD